MKIKEGVILDGVKGVMFFAAVIVEKHYQRYGFLECVITSGTEGKHRTRKHPDGEALDFRIWHIAEASLKRMVADIRAELPPAYDLEIEGDHLHVEWDPKPGETI